MTENEAVFLKYCIRHVDEQQQIVYRQHVHEFQRLFGNDGMGIIRALTERKLIYFWCSDTIVIRQEAIDLLSEFEQNAKQEIDDRAERKKENRRSRLWDVALLVIGGAITLLVEHFVEVCAWLKAAFSK